MIPYLEEYIYCVQLRNKFYYTRNQELKTGKFRYKIACGNAMETSWHV